MNQHLVIFDYSVALLVLVTWMRLCASTQHIHVTITLLIHARKAPVLVSLLGQEPKNSASAVPPNLMHIYAPTLQTYYHTSSLDNGRKSRWALLELTRSSLLPPSQVHSMFFHLLQSHHLQLSVSRTLNIYSSWSLV